MKKRAQLQWLIDSGMEDAAFYRRGVDSTVECEACPRGCVLSPDQFGTCFSRYNFGGALKTLIWGKMLLPSIEPIETEAVFHYWPGAKILSLGNIGCNLACAFCQNWETSSMLRVDPRHIVRRTPEQVVELAQAVGVNVISYTYNDPAIWFEFIRDVSRLAHNVGIKTLFKSAGYVSSKTAHALTEFIDIFSISLKTINPTTFRKASTGRLVHVLNAIKTFYESGRHLEISNLIVTAMNDVESEIKELSRWIVHEMSANVPVHFVRFHPAYKYTDVERTPIGFLEKAREIGRTEGLRYVYIGNTYRAGHADVLCDACGNRLVKRFGLYSDITGVGLDGHCRSCGAEQALVVQPERIPQTGQQPGANWLSSELPWQNEDTRCVHVQLRNEGVTSSTLLCEHRDRDGLLISTESFAIPAGVEMRVSVGQKQDHEKRLILLHPPELRAVVAELLDRAHFPIESMPAVSESLVVSTANGACGRRFEPTNSSPGMP